MLTVIVATTGRPTLTRAIVSAAERLPITEIIIAPAPGVVVPGLHVGCPVRVLEPTTNLYEAWNLSVALAAGPHVLFLNDDDRIEGVPLSPSVLSYDGPVNIRLRLEGRRRRISISAIRKNGRVAAIDIFHANRAGNINSYLWPLDLIRQIGPFTETFRISGDKAWMQRVVGEDLSVRWLNNPVYFQARGTGRLSSWTCDDNELYLEAERVVEQVQQRHGRRGRVAALAFMWLLVMRLRCVFQR